jgi:regulator of sirC expression with transglutaminase-like and TPR domain
MNQNELKALVYLLDDDDTEVANHVENKLRSLGGSVIPLLETEWAASAMGNPHLHQRLENIIQQLRYQSVVDKLLLWKEGGAMDLLEGLWIVATYQHPDLSLEKLRQDVEQLYYEVWLEFRNNMTPVEQIRTLNSVFFGKLKFGANTRNFHSAANSMINMVIDSHRGNPISLCVIYMLIGNKLGLPLFGVNLPNLFVLTYKTPDVQFYINVFNRGLVFTKNDIDNYIAQINIAPNEMFYQPCSNLDIVKRVLRNIILAFEKTGDENSMKEVENILHQIE